MEATACSVAMSPAAGNGVPIRDLPIRNALRWPPPAPRAMTAVDASDCAAIGANARHHA